MTKRGYKNNELKKRLTKADALDWKELLKYNTKKSNDRVPLELTYSDAWLNVHNIDRQRITTLPNSERMREVFPAPSLIAYRRDKNVKDILVHKKHSNIFYGYPDKFDPCGKKSTICQYVIPTDTFQGTDGQTYHVKGENNCKTTSIIYCLVCKRCDKMINVGQTGLSLHVRKNDCQPFEHSKQKTRSYIRTLYKQWTLDKRLPSHHYREELRNIKRDFYLDVYTILNRIELTIWTICAFRVLKPYQ